MDETDYCNDCGAHYDEDCPCVDNYYDYDDDFDYLDEEYER